jgi:hypothetical protein
MGALSYRSHFFGCFPIPRELEGSSRSQQGNFQSNERKQMKTIVRSMNRSHSRGGFFILAVALCWFALSPALKAGCPNPPGVCFGQNTAVGQDALFNVTTGVWNVGVGVQALFNDTIGNQNTAIGYQTLFTNVDGDHSTGIGSQALFNNTSGSDNVGVGFRTLYTNTTGSRNTGMGYRTLSFSDTGSENTAIGWNALYNNRNGGDFNTAVGSQAALHNLNSEFNVAVGDSSLASFNGTTATDGANTALGSIALTLLTSGQENVAVGRRALENLASASNNTAVGWRSGDNLIDGNNDVTIGSSAGVTFVHANNNIAIGAPGGGNFADSSNTCFIGSIHDEPVSDAGSAQAVFVDQFNVLGFLPSSERFKHDITPMDKASEVLYGLKPVTFKYNNDKTGKTQYGVIAEEVAKVAPDLVFRDKNGIVETLRFEQIGAMMLNEFLKEHKKVEEQQASIADLKSTVTLQQKEMQVLTAQLKEQAMQIQKVSAQLQTTKSAPQTVANNP